MADRLSPESIFLNALEIGSEQDRSVYLDEVCGDDVKLRDHVERLIEAHPHADGFLESPDAGETALRSFVDNQVRDGSREGKSSLQDDVPLGYLRPSDDPQLLGHLGSYEIVEVIGQGGMGVVLKGRDPSLNRMVAVKVLTHQLASDAVARRRFLREAQAAAAVSHDHVVTIHAVDEENEPPFLVMEFVSGISLADRIKRDGPLPLEKILRIGSQTASGLAAAHAQGLVHRDIKPANILLENGVERVKITDFGLARARDDAQLTQSGVVAGTPEYMSPEQASGEQVDQRSDLFSLGCVLYAMCTGRSPFRATTVVDAIRRVCDDTPRPIRDINSETPDWLTRIIDRLLAKRRDDRLQTAAEVADLLSGHLAHVQRPTEVPKPPSVTNVTPGRRSRMKLVLAAGGLLAIAVFLLTEATGVTHVARSIFGRPPQNNAKIDPTPPPQTGRLDIRMPPNKQRQDFFYVTVRGNGFEETFHVQKDHTNTLPVGDYEIEIRNKQTHELKKHGWIHVFHDHVAVVHVRSLSTDLPPAPRQHRPSIVLPCEAELHSVALSGDGLTLAVAGQSEGVQIWTRHGSKWKRRSPIVTGNSAVLCVEFSPDGEVVAAASQDGTIVLCNLSTRAIQRLVGHKKPALSIAFLRDGKLATAGWDPEVLIWDINSGRLLSRLKTDQPSCVAASPDGDVFATGHGDGRITIWEADGAESLRTIPAHARHVASLMFSPDGQSLLSASWDSTAKIWDVASGQRVRTLGRHRSSVASAAFSPNGDMVVSTDYGGIIRLWSTESGILRDEFFSHWSGVSDVAFSSAGHMATVGADGSVHIGDARNWTSVESGPIDDAPPLIAALRATTTHNCIALSSDGTKLGVGIGIGQFDICDMPDLYVRSTFTSPPKHAQIDTAVFLPDGNVLTAAPDTIKQWDIKTGAVTKVMSHFRGRAIISVSRDGKTVAATHGNNTITLWDRKTGKKRRSFLSQFGNAFQSDFSPDGSYLAAATGTGSVVVWDLRQESPVPIRLIHGVSKVYNVEFSPDGKTLVSSADKFSILLWEVGSWRKIGTLTAPTEYVLDVAFSRDGRFLACGGGKFNQFFGPAQDNARWDGRVGLFDVRNRRMLGSFQSHLGPVGRVIFTPCGEQLVTLGRGKMVRLWDIRGFLRQSDPAEEDNAED